MSTFEQAAEDVKGLTGTPTDAEKLQLYALYKIGTNEEAKQAGMLDFAGKAKYKAWKEKKDSGITQEEAKAEYIKLVEELKTKYGA